MAASPGGPDPQQALGWSLSSQLPHPNKPPTTQLNPRRWPRSALFFRVALDCANQMIVLLSPAKALDLDEVASGVKASTPIFAQEASSLVLELKKLTQAQLKALLGVSDDLAKWVHLAGHAMQAMHHAGQRADLFLHAGSTMLDTLIGMRLL